jgi:fructose-1,6-bisphosphatase/inositol monophosphatase family enzyme
MSHAELLAAAEEVARAAGALIREAHKKRGAAVQSHEVKALEDHGDHQVDLVTATDRAAEELIIGTLMQRYPEHVFIGEESSNLGYAPSTPLELTDAPTWIIDPLDGTTNFVHGFPLVTVSIGLAIGRQVVLGVIYNPIIDDLCCAVRGGGTRLNGVPVRVGSAGGVTEALVVNNFGASRDPAVNALHAARLRQLLDSGVRGLRNTGSAAQNMMDVACGKLDAYFEAS